MRTDNASKERRGLLCQILERLVHDGEEGGCTSRADESWHESLLAGLLCASERTAWYQADVDNSVWAAILAIQCKGDVTLRTIAYQLIVHCIEHPLGAALHRHLALADDGFVRRLLSDARAENEPDLKESALRIAGRLYASSAPTDSILCMMQGPKAALSMFFSEMADDNYNVCAAAAAAVLDRVPFFSADELELCRARLDLAFSSASVLTDTAAGRAACHLIDAGLDRLSLPPIQRALALLEVSPFFVHIGRWWPRRHCDESGLAGWAAVRAAAPGLRGRARARVARPAHRVRRPRCLL